MIIALAMAASAALAEAPQPTLPPTMRGGWDLPGKCRLPADDSDSRVIVRPTEAVFSELVFTPYRVKTSTSLLWIAAGEWSEEGDVSQGTLTLHLTQAGKVLTYTDSSNHTVRLVRCSGRPAPR